MLATRPQSDLIRPFGLFVVPLFLIRRANHQFYRMRLLATRILNTAASVILLATPASAQTTVLGHRLRWIDLSGRWELLTWPADGDSAAAPTVLPLVFGMYRGPEQREDRPAFRALFTGTGERFARDTVYRVNAANLSSDSIRIHVSSVDLQREARDSAAGIARIGDAMKIVVDLALSGDSAIGQWRSMAHYAIPRRGKAVLRPGSEPNRPVPTRELPPVRELTRIAASQTIYRSKVDAKPLSDGRIFVSDYARKRAVIVAPNLVDETIVYDSLSPGSLKYPRVPASAFVGSGDTIYVPDANAGGIRVISPRGEVVRRLRVADPEDIYRLSNLFSGTQFHGGDVYFTTTLVPRRPGNFSAEPHDSLYLVRLSLATGRRDTLGIVLSPRGNRVIPTDSIPGEPQLDVMFGAPFDVGDAMAVTSTGSLAVIRANDFHVDWRGPDGKWTSTPPAQWEWMRLYDAQKRQVMADRNAIYAQGRAQAIAPVGRPVPTTILQSARVPDYVPAFVPMSAVADYRGRIWVQLGVRMIGITPGPTIYAAIDSTGQIVDRIQLPENRTLVGFDRFGKIYATSSERGSSIEVYRPE